MDKFIQSIVKEAGDAVMRRFGKDGMHYMKSKNLWDVVTKADLLSEKILIKRIKEQYPSHGIISEESGVHNEGAEYVWVMDPIDGTLNFSLGIPMFGVMVCLVKRGEVILSAIYLPSLKEFFFAKKGKGTYLNGKRVRCSQKKDLDQTFGCGPAGMQYKAGRLMQNLVRENKNKVVHFNSFASMCTNACYTACGRRDWIVPLNGSIWDFAPAYLILKESGCKVSDTKGRPWKFGVLEMVAANPVLHKKLLPLTKNL